MIGDAPMNFRPGKIIRRAEGEWLLEIDGVRGPWPQSSMSAGTPLGGDAAAPTEVPDVIVGVRSCDLDLAASEAVNCSSWSWTGIVSTVEFQGSRRMLSIQLDVPPRPILCDGSVAPQSTKLRLLTAGTNRLSVGDRCRVTATADALHVFDAHSGERLTLDLDQA